MRYRFLLLASLIGAATLVSAAATPPKLAVIIVVDQMRADYVDRFADEWTGGLKRLVSQGAWFRQAAYPYLDTVTCAGHATIGTGAFPSTHGVFANAWFDRSTNALVACTSDPAVTPIPYGRNVAGGDSPVRLTIPTFADEMREQKHAHVVALSLKARSAIMLAGHGGDAVTWLSDGFEGWESSSAYASAPVPQVKAFLSANPVEADLGRTWTRLLPADRYKEPDAGLGEAPPAGWTTTFPHVLNGASDGRVADPTFYAQWELSPYANAYLGRMAAALVDGFQLGKHDTTDVLAVSFSSPDLVGHAFGPDSQEIHDIYANLDLTIGTLLDALDRSVGRDEYVVVLSADHGVTEIPEQLKAQGRDGGRLDSLAILQAAQDAAASVAGPGTYVSHMANNDLYMEPGMFEKVAAVPGGLAAMKTAVEGRPGVARAFDRLEMASGTTSSDRLLRAAALSYVPMICGEIKIAPKPGWMIGTSGTTHGSPNPDDQHVPILLFGKGIKPGRYDDAATPADIAPTLAALSGITLPKAQGKPLESALADAASASAAAPR